MAIAIAIAIAIVKSYSHGLDEDLSAHPREAVQGLLQALIHNKY